MYDVPTYNVSRYFISKVDPFKIESSVGKDIVLKGWKK